MAHNDIVWIYHERQESALCARHCLNNLLQGVFVTEFELANIAQELDEEERNLVQGDEEMVKWMKENNESQNVGLDGNFSVQVIRRALANLGLELLDLGSKEATGAAEHPEREEAFICNLDAHWFAIRKISAVWYNLNSLSGLPDTPAKPNVISDFFLSAFLSSLRNDGYSIFVVKGKFPIPVIDPDIGEKANWYKASELKSYHDTYPKELQKQVNQSRAGHSVLTGPSSTNMEDNMIEQAIQQSLGRNESTGNMFDNDMELALAMSMSHTNDKSNTSDTTTTKTEKSSGKGKGKEQTEDEDELSKAMLMSLQSDFESKVPAEPDNTVDPSKICEIRLSLPNGSALTRKFLKENTIGDVIHFVKSQTSYHGDLELICFPTTILKEEKKKLGEIPELGGKAKLTVKPKQ